MTEGIFSGRSVTNFDGIAHQAVDRHAGRPRCDQQVLHRNLYRIPHGISARVCECAGRSPKSLGLKGKFRQWEHLLRLLPWHYHWRDKLRCWGPAHLFELPGKEGSASREIHSGFSSLAYDKSAGPELIYGFRGSMAALQAPLSTLRRAPRHALRMTRGRFDLLFLSC